MSAAALALPETAEKAVAPLPAHSLINEVVLYAVASLLLFCPLTFGAVEPWAIFVLQSVSAILFAIWTIGQLRRQQFKLIWSPVFPPMLAFAGIVLAQLLPGVSAYTHATSGGFLLYVSYGVICFLVTQTFTRTRHLRRVATVLIIYGTTVAMFAILQSLSSAGKLYWIRKPYFGGWIYGPYVNHNHYAGLMEMLVPVPLVFAFSRYARGRERWAAASAAAFMGATIFLSGSRGGMAAFALQMLVFFYFLFKERHRESTAFLLGAFLLISLATIAWVGGNRVSARIVTLNSDHRSELSSDIRFKIDRDTLHMVAKRPVLGWGLGTFGDVYPQFRSFYTSMLVDKAHNDYLQLTAETGLVGLGTALWFLSNTIRAAWRKTHKWPSEINGAVSVAAILSITGILVHSLVDFNLQIPSNAALFYVLCTVAAMDSRFVSQRRGHSRVRTNDQLIDSAAVF